MSGWIIAPSGLIEPVPAPEILVDGIGAIEEMGGGNIRYHLVQEQLAIETAVSIPQRVVVVKIVAPASVVPLVIAQLAQCVIRDGGPPLIGKPRLVT